METQRGKTNAKDTAQSQVYSGSKEAVARHQERPRDFDKEGRKEGRTQI